MSSLTHPAMSAPAALSARVGPEAPAPAVEGLEALIILLGGRRFAVPIAAIVRILPMAALTALPDTPPSIAGILAFQGLALPVVDPRPRLGLPFASPQPDQHLIVIAARTRYLLWIDRAEAIVAAPSVARAPVPDDVAMIAPQLLRVDDEHLPVLSPDALDPGPVLAPSVAGTR